MYKVVPLTSQQNHTLDYLFQTSLEDPFAELQQSYEKAKQRKREGLRFLHRLMTWVRRLESHPELCTDYYYPN